MVSFYPNIPEIEALTAYGEFVFLMDHSGSLQCPMGKQDRTQLCIDATKVKPSSFFSMSHMLKCG
jgi:hypothetical protein